MIAVAMMNAINEMAIRSQYQIPVSDSPGHIGDSKAQNKLTAMNDMRKIAEYQYTMPTEYLLRPAGTVL